MSSSLITPTEALLEVAKQQPFLVAIRNGEDEWSYAALWARVRKIADKIHDLDDTRNPVGLYTGLEIDYVAAAHAIWLSGRTVVLLSLKWTPDVLRIVLERARVHLVLFCSSEPPAQLEVRAVSTHSIVNSMTPPSHILPPSLEEVVETVPRICSITATSGSIGAPKLIIYPMRRNLAVLSDDFSTHFKPMNSQWLRVGTTFVCPLFEIRSFMFNRSTLCLDASSVVGIQRMADSLRAHPGHSADVPEDIILSKVDMLTKIISAEVKKLSRSSDVIPMDLPLLYAGLTSIAMVRLYFWLQSEYGYAEQIHHLFDEIVTVQVIALEILGDDEGMEGTTSPASQATIVEDDEPDVLTLEKDPDHVEKEHALYPVHGFESPRKSTQMVMQPPVETATNNIAAHPRLEFTPYSFLFVSWITPLLLVGSKRPLSESDLLPLRQNDEAVMVERWVEPFWAQLRAWFLDMQGSKSPKLFRVIFSATSKLWIISGFLWFLSICSAVLSPLILQQIIVATNVPPPPTGDATALAELILTIEFHAGGFPLITKNTYVLGGMLLGLKLIFTLCGRSSDQLVKRVALDVRTALISAVYKKSLRLSAENHQKYGTRYIMNLINVDCESVSKAWEQIHQIWSIPLQLIVIAVFLSRLLDVSALPSVGVLMSSLFLLILVIPVYMHKVAPSLIRLGDHRLKTIREVLDGIRAVKINGYEMHFLEKLEGIRTEQLGWLRKFNIGVTTFTIVGQVAYTTMPLVAFSLFCHENMGVVNISTVFPALSFFIMLVDPLISLPQFLSSVVIATTSWGRISVFLLAEEKPSSTGSSIPSVNTDHAITIVDGAFSWAVLDRHIIPSSTKATDNKTEASSIDTAVKNDISGPGPLLRDVNITIPTGSLTAIVGNVGSGKSSLLSAIIGEMVRVSGEVYCNGSIAYCGQQPWIQTTTIQDNILFGRPLDMHLLHKATQITCFNSDLETFPHGMATQINEKGSKLSGGQKARLALSRAVYSDADIYLFDDILAALDPRVGRTVFNNCIRNALQGKTRVLVTHQLQYLNQVDHIIVVSDGTIVEQGSFHDLVSKTGELTRLLSGIEATSVNLEDTMNGEKRESKFDVPKAVIKEQGATNQVIAEEERNTDTVGATWWAYLSATGGIQMVIMLLVEIVLLQGSVVIVNQWLIWRTEDTFEEKAPTWIGIYNGIGVTCALAFIILNITLFLNSIHASRTFHSKALQGVIYAPMWWFESQSIGQIMNGFSKDIEAIDQRLMPQLFQLVVGIGNLISVVVILAYSTPIMLVFVFPMLVIYWFVLKFYRKSLRELKRLESIGRGPLQSRISETLDGISTIMAYGRATDVENVVGLLLNESNKPMFLRMHAEIWVTLRMEIMFSLIVVALVMLAHTKVVGNSSQFVLALTYASNLTYIMNLLLRGSANVETEVNSVERLVHYSTSLPREGPAHIESDPGEGIWPPRGEIVLRNIDAAYHSCPDKLILRNVSLTFNAGETVFIVGRTGSGKSMLLSLLLRMVESSNGTVEIDGRDIKSLGLLTLRRGMQVIPQDPFIFSGTIRTCLDIDGKHEDNKLWHALDLVGLRDFVCSQECKLDTVIKNNGEIFSVGLRQLLCLATAVLRNSKILLLDEATASIDADTDIFIQNAMRRSLPDATILSIIHRLNDRILEKCDKVLVMEQGVPIEYASPQSLLAHPNSTFSKLMVTARHNH